MKNWSHSLAELSFAAGRNLAPVNGEMLGGPYYGFYFWRAHIRQDQTPQMARTILKLIRVRMA